MNFGGGHSSVRKLMSSDILPGSVNQDIDTFVWAVILRATGLSFELQPYLKDMLLRSSEAAVMNWSKIGPGGGGMTPEWDSGCLAFFPQTGCNWCLGPFQTKNQLSFSLALDQCKQVLQVNSGRDIGVGPSKPWGCDGGNTVTTCRCLEVKLNTIKWCMLSRSWQRTCGASTLYWVLKSTFPDSMMHEKGKKWVQDTICYKGVCLWKVQGEADSQSWSHMCRLPFTKVTGLIRPIIHHLCVRTHGDVAILIKGLPALHRK